MVAELLFGTQPPGFTLSMANQTDRRYPLSSRRNFCFLAACSLWLGCALPLLQAIYARSPAVPERATCHDTPPHPFLGSIWPKLSSSPSWLTRSCFSRSSPDGHTDDVRKGARHGHHFQDHLAPPFARLPASMAPHEILGSDNGMTGQSTGHGQYMPPWTPYIASAPASPIPPSRRPHSATLNTRRQPPCFPVSPPLSACCLCMADVPLPLVCATASHASLSRPGLRLSLRNVAQR